MRLTGRWLTAQAVWCAALLALVAAPARAQTPARALDFAAIDAYVQRAMTQAPIPGLAYGIAQGDQVVHLQAYGRADAGGRPVTPQTPFVISSVTKTFTALAVRQQVNAGRLDLDAPVQRYIPWFRVADAAISAQITPRMLLEHTSGFSTRDGTATYLDDPRYTLEDLVRRCATIQLQHTPGPHEYSNINYLVLGLIIERLSGQPYDAYVQANIFAPLGLRHSYTTQAAAAPDGLAAGHRLWYGLAIPTEQAFAPAMHPAGYLISSAEDLARYTSLYFTEGRYGGVSLLVPAGMPAPAPTGLVYDGYWEPEPGPASDRWLWNQQGGSINYNSDLMLAQGSRTGVVVLLNSRPDTIIPALTAYDIALGVMRQAQGQAPEPLSDHGFRQGWLQVDALLLLLLAFVAARVWGLRGWARTRGRPGGHAWRSALSVALDLVVALGLLAGLPALNNLTWEVAFQSMPDLAVALLGSGLALVGVAVAKGLLAARGLRVRRARVAPAAA